MSRLLADGALLRRARPGDEEAILALIQELAVCEREPDAVQSTADSLRQALFGPAPALFAHVVERDGRVVGIAVWFVNFSTWTGRHGIYLEDLVVGESERGRGYGKALVAELARIALERGYPRVDWSVLDWNASAIAFYRSIGAHPMDQWTGHRLEAPALEALALHAPAQPAPAQPAPPATG
ncbi:MAG: GNAT family N-acetyltransferase [Bifidobacteriaceae bacterium]|jgi:GNAT superfamily N-acetyltransferase|nr:GNAT family N-acetyltransferase [Bifidobacteriaceae bacterium]